jgi:hypothetical protein
MADASEVLMSDSRADKLQSRVAELEAALAKRDA